MNTFMYPFLQTFSAIGRPWSIRMIIYNPLTTGVITFSAFLCIPWTGQWSWSPMVIASHLCILLSGGLSSSSVGHCDPMIPLISDHPGLSQLLLGPSPCQQRTPPGSWSHLPPGTSPSPSLTPRTPPYVSVGTMLGLDPS